jgi:hypothetical protein
LPIPFTKKQIPRKTNEEMVATDLGQTDQNDAYSVVAADEETKNE